MPPADAAAADLAAGALPFVTEAAWALAQKPHLAELLVEQAHLEKKAAAAAVSLLFRIPTLDGTRRGIDVHRDLSALAREELVHFERTLRLLAARGISFRTLAPSDYAGRLKAAIGSTMPQRLADELLVSAIIEARSCERMGLLATALQDVDAEVATFYADLCAAEARHQSLYIELASTLLPAADVARRWGELGRHEAAVLGDLPWAPRLHSGVTGRCG